MSPTIKSLLRRLEVKHDGDAFIGRQPTRWGNRDIWPVPKEQQRFSAAAYWAFWTIASMSITGWAYGGSVLALGLTPGEGIAATVVGSVFVTALAYLCGHPGGNKHLGFTMMGRATFGLYGSYLPVLLLIFENVIFFGINSYFGGLAAVVMINAMSPNFMTLKNTLPESAGITTQALTGFLVFITILFPLIFIHPSKVYKLVLPGACAIAVTFFGLFGWAISTNGGSAGKLLSPIVQLSSTNRAFAILYAISSGAGSVTGYAARISDWTRFAKTPNAPTIPLLVTIPIAGSLTAVLGILATSAVHTKYKVIEWNPLALLLYLQATHYTAACRAATFFAGLAIFWAMICNNLMAKLVPAGMDVAGMLPKYITTRRGSVGLCVLGIVIQPWRFLTQSTTFLTVLSSFGVFIAPMTAILTCDYWLVRKRTWKIPDLFRQDGIYWYTIGINWRAIVAFSIGFIPSLPGLACSINHHPIAIGWTRIYQCCYILGLAISSVVYCLICLVLPPAGTGIGETFESDLVDGSAGENGGTTPSVHDEEKLDAATAIEIEHVTSS